MIELLDPQIGEEIYDPASGSCGFLAQAHEYIVSQGRAGRVEDYHFLQERAFHGQEKKALSALLGTMNMILHGVAAPNIRRINTLEENVRGGAGRRYDIILTNPPFGGTEGRHIQQNFTIQSNATELLFLQHVIKKLKATPNGRAAMVAPEGTLFRGGAFAQVKKDLLEQFHLFAIVSLPPGTFAPYSDVKTALLFFQRPDRVMADNPLARDECWYYELPVPATLKKFSKGSRIADSNFAEARQLWPRWKAYLHGQAERPFPLADELRQQPPSVAVTAWVESLAALRDRDYDLSARNPSQDEQAALPNPAELTARLLERSREIHSILEGLQAMLNDEENGHEL
jgi:type I restriction enzyme M protein